MHKNKILIVRSNVVQTLASQVQELAKGLRRLEKEYYLKRKEIIGEEEVIPMKGNRGQSQEDFLNDGDAMELNAMELVAKSKDVEINNLVKGINDLAVIFKELSVLVIDQGNILDRVDYNIEQAMRHTKKANVELHKVI